MMKTPDLTKTMQDMMQNLPVDTSSMQDAFRTQSQLGERMSRVALEAAERSTEISAQWAKDTIARVGELAAVKDQPADYAKAMSAFATAASELASQHMAAFAEVAKRVQMDTVDLMVTAGKDIAEDAQQTADKVSRSAAKTGKSDSAKA